MLLYPLVKISFLNFPYIPQPLCPVLKKNWVLLLCSEYFLDEYFYAIKMVYIPYDLFYILSTSSPMSLSKLLKWKHISYSSLLSFYMSFSNLIKNQRFKLGITGRERFYFCHFSESSKVFFCATNTIMVCPPTTSIKQKLKKNWHVVLQYHSKERVWIICLS